jgi:DnaJ-class molecular chaperone
MAADLYETLGVKRDASAKDIREAYRRLARQYHPDVNPGDEAAEARFKEINAAHQVLSDAESRDKYDRYGEQWQQADQIDEIRRQQRAAGGRGGFDGGGFSFDFGGQGVPEGVDIEELFGAQRGGHGGAGLFDRMFRRGAGGGRRRGRDAEHPVRIVLEEAYRGATRTIEVAEGGGRCRVCAGAGQVADATCHSCRGSGSAGTVRRLEVTIPAGIRDGARVRLAGKGGQGANGGPPGDLYLRVAVAPHPVFTRRGDDLELDVDVPVWDAALGAEARVPTLKGKTLALSIPAGTEGGRVFRLAGQGMPRSGGFGDLLARVRITLPGELTAEQRELLARLRDTSTSGDDANEAQSETQGETESAAGAAS